MAVTRKKVFQNTADIIRRRVDEFDPKKHEPEVLDMLRQLAIDFAMFFKTDNPNFDAERFAISCGFADDDVAAIRWAINTAASSGS